VRLRGNIDATSATNLSSKLAAEADIGCRVSKPVASHGGALTAPTPIALELANVTWVL
jgi:hypothetical protein